jgi:multicomponent Na+:H+ antiporter subunit D
MPGIGLPPPMVWLIIVPLLALLAAVPLGRRAARLMPIVALVMPALALWLIVEISLGGPQEHTLGGWSPPLGIALRADGLSAAMLLLTALLGAAAGLF